ncbi:MAG: metallophosphoesterase [Bacilli bacterium]|nr:metallophosphoesterase [Bacilli bacterium]
MKKIVVMSDNHGYQDKMELIMNLENDGDYYVHCGDSETYREDDLRGWICVRGNNDWSLDLPKEAILEVEGVRILITHGQFFGYFNRELKMLGLLQENDCTVLFSGHTHMPSIVEEGEYTFINPGSVSLPRGGSKASYAVVYIDNGKVKAEIKEIKKK